ncbi:sulfite oxidase [Mumia sp. zg.B21]|uniref:sulfite oxidase n=1 Tax=unclassified Mumia TaxID=2621872 RepID=UPI001C6EDD1E|nr:MULTISPECIES: sulfite oxidase [unclassified Mumia]MBW9211494.1 sulfite oxidase [Mumia sp. zg.B21]MDD9348270.1 sulfite oxidase [Mumia sp.]
MPPASSSYARRDVLRLGAGAAAALVAARAVGGSAAAAAPAPGSLLPLTEGPILKPLPPEWFVPLGTNAEMRWDSVDPRRYLTAPERLFVRNHTRTPIIDARTWELRIHGDGLADPRTPERAHVLTYRDLRRLPARTVTTVLECTGNGRTLFATQQGTPVSGTAWGLGAVGTVRWTGVPLSLVLRRLGIRRDAVDIQATGLDEPFVSGGVDYGRVRRPFPVAKALEDALLVYAMDGRPLLPDHGFPVRLLLPGWVGIASIKWLGELEVSRTTLTSPWNTKWYRMTGPDYPADSPPLTVLPVKSVFEPPTGLASGRRTVLTGRSWSGAGAIRRVEVSTDGGETWQRARTDRARGSGWTQWSHPWRPRSSGEHVLLARATDVTGRTQPDQVPFNDGGYFFSAVVQNRVAVA